jgi:hypothetical protein
VQADSRVLDEYLPVALRLIEYYRQIRRFQIRVVVPANRGLAKNTKKGYND